MTANCFAMGEYRYGAYAGNNDFVGLTLGTGMGCRDYKKRSALIPDAHCCSGEFGTMSYLDGIYEYYTSGPCILNVKYGKNGEVLWPKQARTEEPWAAKEAYNGSYGNAPGQCH